MSVNENTQRPVCCQETSQGAYVSCFFGNHPIEMTESEIFQESLLQQLRDEIYAKRWDSPILLNIQGQFIPELHIECRHCLLSPFEFALLNRAPDCLILTLLEPEKLVTNQSITRYPCPLSFTIRNSKPMQVSHAIIEVLTRNAKKSRYESGFCLLQYSISHNIPECYLREVIEADEGAVALAIDGSAETLLNFMLRKRNFSDETILVVINACLDSVMVRNNWGLLPLQQALIGSFSDKVVQKLFNIYKDAAAELIPKLDAGAIVWRNILPFHLAIIQGYHCNSIVQRLFEAVLDQVVTLRKEKEFVLLHYVIKHNELFDYIVPALIADKDAAACKMAVPADLESGEIEINKTLVYDSSSNEEVYPSHMAMLKHVPEEIVLSLFESYTLASTHPLKLHDSDSNEIVLILPFHLAALGNFYSIKLCWFLFDEVRGLALYMREVQNCVLPLHYILQHRLCDQYATEILLSDKDAAKVKFSDKGDLPLSRAIKLGYSEKVLLDLIDAYEYAAVMRCDADKRLPIHECALSFTSPKVVAKLLEIYPNGLEKVDRYGNLPSDLVQPSLPTESIALICDLNKKAELSSSMHSCYSYESDDEEPEKATILSLSGMQLTRQEVNTDENCLDLRLNKIADKLSLLIDKWIPSKKVDSGKEEEMTVEANDLAMRLDNLCKRLESLEEAIVESKSVDQMFDERNPLESVQQQQDSHGQVQKVLHEDAEQDSNEDLGEDAHAVAQVDLHKLDQKDAQEVLHKVDQEDAHEDLQKIYHEDAHQYLHKDDPEDAQEFEWTSL